MSGLFCGTDAADDLRMGQRVQRRLPLGGRKGAVGQQAAVKGAVCPYNIRPEALRQLGQQRRAGKQDLAGELVGVCQRDVPGRKNRGDGGFAAAAAAGDAQRHHSSITRNAAARIRRL